MESSGVGRQPRLEDHIRWLREDVEMGFQELDLHNVNRQQRKFIEDFGAHVVPEILKQVPVV